MKGGYSMTLKIAFIFLSISFIYVVMQTIKTILTVKGSTFSAASSNAITYAFYTLVLKQVADLPLTITIPVTLISNFFGVYLANYILQKTRKDKLWKITATIKTEQELAQIRILMRKYELRVNIFRTINNSYVVDFFSYSQKESANIKYICDTYNLKYIVTEAEKRL